MTSGAYRPSAARSRQPSTAYLAVAGILAGFAALLNCLVMFVSIFATDNCPTNNPPFRCTEPGILTTWSTPWAALIVAVGASAAPLLLRRGARLWWVLLPVGVAVYVGGLFVTWRVMGA